jgi:hypothetical protein
VNTQELVAHIDQEIARLQNARNILAGFGRNQAPRAPVWDRKETGEEADPVRSRAAEDCRGAEKTLDGAEKAIQVRLLSRLGADNDYPAADNRSPGLVHVLPASAHTLSLRFTPRPGMVVLLGQLHRLA